jgi:hypothetical protein
VHGGSGGQPVEPTAPVMGKAPRPTRQGGGTSGEAGDDEAVVENRERGGAAHRLRKCGSGGSTSCSSARGFLKTCAWDRGASEMVCLWQVAASKNRG